MSCSKIKLDNLFFISMNKDLLKKMKVEYSVDTYNEKVIDEFAKMKQRIKSIYK